MNTFYLEVARDYDKRIFKLLDYVQGLSNSGHSFPVDIDDSFDNVYIDGDGNCYISSLKVLTRGSRKVRNFNLGKLFKLKDSVLYEISGSDCDYQLRKLLRFICSNSQAGHTLDFVVDPDDSEFRRVFEIDGDGPDLAYLRREVTSTDFLEAKIID